MAKADLEEGLNRLRQSIRRMKALLSWEQLKKSESKSRQTQVFQIPDSTETDLRNEYSSFLSTSVKIHHLFDANNAIPKKKLQAIKRQLVKIGQDVDHLGLHQRFLNPSKFENEHI